MRTVIDFLVERCRSFHLRGDNKSELYIDVLLLIVYGFTNQLHNHLGKWFFFFFSLLAGSRLS